MFIFVMQKEWQENRKKVPLTFLFFLPHLFEVFKTEFTRSVEAQNSLLTEFWTSYKSMKNETPWLLTCLDCSEYPWAFLREFQVNHLFIFSI